MSLTLGRQGGIAQPLKNQQLVVQHLKDILLSFRYKCKGSVVR